MNKSFSKTSKEKTRYPVRACDATNVISNLLLAKYLVKFCTEDDKDRSFCVRTVTLEVFSPSFLEAWFTSFLGYEVNLSFSGTSKETDSLVSLGEAT